MGVIMESLRNVLLGYPAFLIRNKGKVLLAILALTAAMCANFGKIRFAHLRSEEQLRKEDPAALQYKQFTDEFGNDLNLLVAVESGRGIFTSGNLQLLKSLTASLEKLGHVDKVTSLANANYQWSEGEAFNSRMFLDLEPFPETPAGIAELEKSARAYKPIGDHLLSPDGNTSVLVIKPKPTMMDALQAYQEIKGVLGALPAGNGLKIRMVGEAVGFAEFNRLIGAESAKITLIMFILMAGLLWVCFRSFWGVAGTGILSILVIVVTMSTYPLLDHTFGGISLMLTAILLVISILDCIHFYTAYQEAYAESRDKGAALAASIKALALPCFFTSLTTVADFACIAVATNQDLVNLAFHSSFGALLAYLLTFSALPAILAYLPPPVPRKSRELPWIDSLLGTVAAWNRRFRYPLLAASLAVALCLGLGLRQLKADQDNTEMLPKGHALLQDIGFLADKVKVGWQTLPLVIEGQPGSINDPKALHAIDGLERHLRTLPLVVKVDGLVDEMMTTYQVVKGGASGDYRLPDDPGDVSRLYFMVDNSEGVRSILNHDGSKTIVNIQLDRGLMSQYDGIYRQVEEYVAKSGDWPSGLKVKPNGVFSMMSTQYHAIMADQRNSLLGGILCMAAILCLLFRSFKLGLIGLIPNVAPILLLLGFMGWSGIYLSGTLIVVANVAIALAVDDTVHFLFHYRRFRKEEGAEHDAAIASTFKEVGKANFFATFVLTMSMASFLISGIPMLRQTGLLFVVAILIAFLADLFFLPSLLFLARIKPAKTARPEKNRPREVLASSSSAR
jgi:uncharacterized protein